MKLRTIANQQIVDLTVDVTVGNEQIRNGTCVKLLGFVIDGKLSFNAHNVGT